MPDPFLPAAVAPLGVAVLNARDVPAAAAALFATTAPRLLAPVPAPPAGVHRFALITCERVMVVQWGDPQTVAAMLQAAIAAQGVRVDATPLQAYVGVDAVRHLLSLAAGLESSRLGEHEILGQLRTAWGDAWRVERPHPVFDRLLQQVIGAARYVRAVFPPSSSPVTLGDEAVAAVAAAPGSALWASRRALVVGTGSAASSVLAALRRAGPQQLSVIGRTPARVAEVAARYAATPYWWFDLAAAIATHDVVVFAVRSAEPVIVADAGAAPMGAVWVDLGLPPAAMPRTGVQYVGLSALHAAVAADPRRAALGREAVECELRRLVADVARRQVA